MNIITEFVNLVGKRKFFEVSLDVSSGSNYMKIETLLQQINSEIKIPFPVSTHRHKCFNLARCLRIVILCNTNSLQTLVKVCRLLLSLSLHYHEHNWSFSTLYIISYHIHIVIPSFHTSLRWQRHKNPLTEWCMHSVHCRNTAIIRHKQRQNNFTVDWIIIHVFVFV
jgi:hypothetical protein